MNRRVLDAVWGPAGARLLCGDALVLGLLVALLLALLVPGGAGGVPSRAEVEVSGRRAIDIDLGRDGVHEVNGPLGAARLEVRAGRLRVLSSPCPRQSCRHGGWIGEAGELLVCVPNELVARLPGGRPGGADGITR